VNILIAEALETVTEGYHHGIRQLGVHPTPSLIAAATSSEVAKPAPFNASLSTAEAVSALVGRVGLIN
jgi:hypothetical protein